MNGLEQEYGERITFVHVNILLAESRPMMARYGFSASPEFYLVDRQGKTIGFWDELTSAEDVRKAFEEALKQNP